MKALFTPVSVLAGLAAGQLSKKLFAAAWGRIDDDEPPASKHREIVLSQLVLALVIEGAVTKLVRGLADHGTRHAWRKLSGEWPGDERPDSA